MSRSSSFIKMMLKKTFPGEPYMEGDIGSSGIKSLAKAPKRISDPATNFIFILYTLHFGKYFVWPC